MIRIVLAFLFVFGVYYFGILAWRDCTGRERLELTRIVLYSIMCAVLTTASLAVFVAVF